MNVAVLSSRGLITNFVALLLNEIEIHFLIYFFFVRHVSFQHTFFSSSPMIIFQIFHYSICSLYFIVGDIYELHLLFILSPGIIYFRHNSFLSKNFIFSIYYPFSPTYSVFQPYWKICEFLKSQILKNQCSNIVPGTESHILVHLLLIHFWETFKVSIFCPT